MRPREDAKPGPSFLPLSSKSPRVVILATFVTLASVNDIELLRVFGKCNDQQRGQRHPSPSPSPSASLTFSGFCFAPLFFRLVCRFLHHLQCLSPFGWWNNRVSGSTFRGPVKTFIFKYNSSSTCHSFNYCYCKRIHQLNDLDPSWNFILCSRFLTQHDSGSFFFPSSLYWSGFRCVPSQFTKPWFFSSPFSVDLLFCVLSLFAPGVPCPK